MIVCRCKKLHHTISNFKETLRKEFNINKRLFATNVFSEDHLVAGKFTNVEIERILNILNSSNADELARYKFRSTFHRCRNSAVQIIVDLT